MPTFVSAIYGVKNIENSLGWIKIRENRTNPDVIVTDNSL